jgi:diguanylate cyclase (GGDEF)-like protein
MIFVKPIDISNIKKRHHLTQVIMCINAFIVHVSLLIVGYIASIYGNFHYQTGSILIIILLCSVIRINFYYVLPTVFLVVASQLYFTANILNESGVVLLEHVFIFPTIALLSCLSNARMESEIRKNFLKSILLEHKKKKLEIAKKELLQQLLSDPLTGLMNRRGFDQNFSKIWLNAIRNKYAISFLMIDIDLFKQCNGSQGHLIGDLSLKSIADILKYELKRPEDFVACLGGEEFAVVMPQTNNGSATLIAETIRKAIWEKKIFHPASKADHRLTISIGLATMIPEQKTSYDLIIDAADIALYKAKENGRNRLYNFLEST